MADEQQEETNQQQEAAAAAASKDEGFVYSGTNKDETLKDKKHVRIGSNVEEIQKDAFVAGESYCSQIWSILWMQKFDHFGFEQSQESHNDFRWGIL